MAAMAESTALNLPPRLVTFFAKYPPRLYGMHFTGATIPTISQKIAREGNKKTGAAPTVIPASTTTATTAPDTISTSTAPTAPAIDPTSTSASTPTVPISETISQTNLDSIPPDATPTSPSAQFSTPTTTSPLLDPETSQPIFAPTDTPPNPFLPYRNPATGRWRGAIISLRRQAELFKLARHYGVEPLLPPSRKASSFKETRLLERGTPITDDVDGGARTTLGPRVKGTGFGQKVKGHKWERGMGVTLQKRIAAMEKMPELIREWRMRGNGRGWKKYPK
ncbi:54S ribosomal protein L25, mitochondrial [Knufia obscura]|uniref:54S ribosomal protein L25, mitochondrial n=2 Tax=Knufia TaxID=430999 RepID=A0AAN8F769_9EURO|nr:54S ribosomal protein L25, mitochondrial [Knufia obscura]KAK5952691.1 54S ribosomal protein L25, mitochondrial [Knufia fluminis]